MHNTAATTHNINTKPAIDIAMAKLRCDIHNASSGLCNSTKLERKALILNLCQKSKVKNAFSYLFSENAVIAALNNFSIFIHIKT